MRGLIRFVEAHLRWLAHRPSPESYAHIQGGEVECRDLVCLTRSGWVVFHHDYGLWLSRKPRWANYRARRTDPWLP